MNSLAIWYKGNQQGKDIDIHINFGRINKNPMVEKHVFRRLVEMGAHVSLKSN